MVTRFFHHAQLWVAMRRTLSQRPEVANMPGSLQVQRENLGLTKIARAPRLLLTKEFLAAGRFEA
jgi:hypothetical protein